MIYYKRSLLYFAYNRQCTLYYALVPVELLVVDGAWVETFSACCSSFMILAGLGPTSSTSIARSGGLLSEEAAATVISQDGGLFWPVYLSTDALLTCKSMFKTLVIKP